MFRQFYNTFLPEAASHQRAVGDSIAAHLERRSLHNGDRQRHRQHGPNLCQGERSDLLPGSDLVAAGQLEPPARRLCQ